MSWVGLILTVLFFWFFGRAILGLIVGSIIGLGFLTVKAYKTTKVGLRGLFSNIDTEKK